MISMFIYILFPHVSLEYFHSLKHCLLHARNESFDHSQTILTHPLRKCEKQMKLGIKKKKKKTSCELIKCQVILINSKSFSFF